MSGRACRRPADCWDWLRPDDLLRHALAAYYAACREIEPPPGEPWVRDGDTWASRANFRDALVGHLVQRINAHGLPAGLTRPQAIWPDLPAGHQWPTPAAHAVTTLLDRLGIPGCRGGAPAMKGHGCPAPAPGALPPASAVGPAPGASDGRDITANGNPLFMAPEMQKLPPVQNPVDNRPSAVRRSE